MRGSRSPGPSRHLPFRRSLACAAVVAALAPAGVLAAPGAAPWAAERATLSRWIGARQAAILAELEALLSIPNVSRNGEDIRRNAEHLLSALQRRGMEARILEPGPPYLFAHLAPEARAADGRPAPRVLFYAHYDGQPVDPARWTTDGPFAPTLRGAATDPEARLYARSASDDKSPIVALLAALDALRGIGLPPTAEVKLLLDPEEEIGSPGLRPVLERHRDLLAADLLIFADGPVHPSGRPTVVFGTRGIVTVTLTVYGPAVPLHSGHYGNWAPNPAEKLADLLASMKDPDGRVLVAGFYDDVVPLSAAEREALAAVPAMEASLQQELLIARPDAVGASLQEAINLPSLNVRGLGSAWIGPEARTIIPSEATAELDLRLVKGIRPEDQVERLRAHVRARGYHVVEEEPSDDVRRSHPRVARLTAGPGVPATRTPLDTPLSGAVVAAIARAGGAEPVLLPTLGGTGPLYPFAEILDLPVYGVPIVNPDNNQHAPDENLRLGNLWEGILLYASLLHLPSPTE